MGKKLTIIIILVGIVVFTFVPIVPIQVVPKVTLKVVDIEGKPMSNIIIIQWWKHWTFESETHRDEITSDESGNATVPERKIWISLFSYIADKTIENTIGLIAIHESYGPYSGFGAKDYKFENKWCYPESRCSNREVSKEIVIKEKNPK